MTLNFVFFLFRGPNLPDSMSFWQTCRQRLLAPTGKRIGPLYRGHYITVYPATAASLNGDGNYQYIAQINVLCNDR